MTIRILICIFVLALPPAWAEMQFPEFESLPDDTRIKWGYNVNRVEGSNPSISIEIPAPAAVYCKAARLYIRTSEGNLLSEVNIAPWTNKDGSMRFTLNLFQQLDGYAELIVYTDHLPDPTIPATRGGFGGFTFTLKSGFQQK